MEGGGGWLQFEFGFAGFGGLLWFGVFYDSHYCCSKVEGGQEK